MCPSWVGVDVPLWPVLKTTLGISGVVVRFFRLAAAGVFLIFLSFSTLKKNKKELVGVWWLVSTFQSDWTVFAEAWIDVPIRPGGGLVAARVDDPIRPAKVDCVSVDVPIQLAGVVCLS